MRIAVISDIHSNLEALDAVLGGLGEVRRRLASRRHRRLRPAAAGGGRPAARRRHHRVRGNHDDAAGGGDSIEFFNPDGFRAMEWTRTRIDERTRLFLAGLPERRVPDGSRLPRWHTAARAIRSGSTSPRKTWLRPTYPPSTRRYCLVGHTTFRLSIGSRAGE